MVNVFQEYVLDRVAYQLARFPPSLLRRGCQLLRENMRHRSLASTPKQRTHSQKSDSYHQQRCCYNLCSIAALGQ